MTGKVDLAASVAARLLNRAKETGDDHQTLLTSYCLERFLYRLGASDRRDRFVLKGAMLLRVWSDRPYRAHGGVLGKPVAAGAGAGVRPPGRSRGAGEAGS